MLVPSVYLEEPRSLPTSMPSLSQTAPPTPAAIVARRPPKVSNVGSPPRLNAVGENLIKNRGSERRIRQTPVSHHHGLTAPLTRALPPDQSRP
jgi:hypothetical protein